MRTILEIYFAVNIFLFGFKMGDRLHFMGNKEFLLSLLLLPFGLITETVIQPLRWLYEKMMRITNINFYIAYFFTKKLDNKTKKFLDDWHLATLKRHNSSSIVDRHWRYCVKLMNKRNNYTYEAPKD